MQENYLDRLKSIREKYTGTQARTRISSQYVPGSKTQLTRRSYINDQELEKRYIDGIDKKKTSDATGDLSFRRANRNKEIEQIRQNYAASRKRVLEEYTKQNHHLHDPMKDYRQTQDYNLSSTLNKDYLKDYQPKDYQEYHKILQKTYDVGKTFNYDNVYTDKDYLKSREFGREFNGLDPRLSFGKDNSIDKLGTYSNLKYGKQGSSPIKKMNQISDLQAYRQETRYAAHAPLELESRKYGVNHDRDPLVRPSSVSNYILPSRSYNPRYIESPVKHQYGEVNPQWGVSNLQKIQSRIQNLLSQKRERL